MIYARGLFIEDREIKISEAEIVSAKRIGVDYAKEDAELNYRFYIKGNKFVSKL